MSQIGELASDAILQLDIFGEPGDGFATAEFVKENRPHRFQLGAQPDSPVWQTWNDMQALIYRALSAGVSPPQLRTMFEQAMTTSISTPRVFDGQG